MPTAMAALRVRKAAAAGPGDPPKSNAHSMSNPPDFTCVSQALSCWCDTGLRLFFFFCGGADCMAAGPVQVHGLFSVIRSGKSGCGARRPPCSMLVGPRTAASPSASNGGARSTGLSPRSGCHRTEGAWLFLKPRGAIPEKRRGDGTGADQIFAPGVTSGPVNAVAFEALYPRHGHGAPAGRGSCGHHP